MRLLRGVGLFSLAAVTAAVMASAAGAAVTGPVQVTGTSPFRPGCAGAGHDTSGTLYEEGEVEPWVAVDPADPNNVSGNWQQDRWSNGGSHGLVASTSTNAGTTWDGETFADFSRCPLFAHTGNPDAEDPGRRYERGSDPWVSWGSGHRIHQIALTANEIDVGLGGRSGILVSHSDDFGATWSHPDVIHESNGGRAFDDKESITADPASGYVYAIWDRLVSPSEHASLKAVENAIGYRGPTWFSASPDNGENWSTARVIYDPGEVNQTIANQIAVAPGGTLIDVFLQINNATNRHKTRGFNVAVMRSTDHGATWSKPVFVSKLVDKTVVTPGDNQDVRTGDIAPDIAIDRSSGAIYVAWQDAVSGTPAIYLAKSTTGGTSWSAPQKVSDSPAGVQAFTPSVDVNSNGAVAVTYYDFRRDTPTTSTALTDYWFRTSTNGGVSWTPSQRVTTNAFDMKKAPVANGYFVGDYEGLDHSGGTFKVFFVQAHNGDTGANPTDVYSSNGTP